VHKQIVISGLISIAAVLPTSNADAQSTRSTRPVAVPPTVGEVLVPGPATGRRPGGPIATPSPNMQVKPGAALTRYYPIISCSIGLLDLTKKQTNPGLQPVFYAIDFVPNAEGIYQSTGDARSFNQNSYRLVETGGVVEFKIEGERSDYVKEQGEILASWIDLMKWTVATGQVKGYYVNYWFATGVSGSCRNK
jgi:hypothetical protein